MQHQHGGGPEGGSGGPGDAELERCVGSRGRGRGVRPVTHEQPSFRQPQHSQQPASGTMSDLVKNSVLSAEAAEFVPKAFTPPSQTNAGHRPRNSVQDRLHYARGNQNAQQAVHQRGNHGHWQQSSGSSQHSYHHHQYSDQGSYHHRGAPYQQHYNQYSNNQEYGQYDGGSGDYIDKHLDTGPVDLSTCLNQLGNAMRTLTMNPGKFDSLVAHLVDTVSPFLDQPSQCEEIFNMIIQQSINEGNFRYSGARLCTHLDTVALSGDKSTSTFRETLVNQCKQKTEEQAETWKQITKHTDDVEKKCHGLIFFLAELVTQMEPIPASELGKLLIRLINTVLQNPAPTSAKNICQALKLAGQTLERDNSGNRTEMEQVMRTLSDLVIQGRVDSHVGRMVTSVSELRSGNWGVSSSHSSRDIETKPPSSSQVTDEPIFYGPDGLEITEEESRFLEEGDLEEELASQEPWENDEEADTVAEAYEEFLRMSMNNNKQNQKNVQTKH